MYSVMRKRLPPLSPLLLAMTLAAPSSAGEAWQEAFDKVAHLLPPGDEIVRVPPWYPKDRPDLPAVIRYEDAYGPDATQPPEPPPRHPLVFVKDLDGDGDDEITTITRAVEGQNKLIRANVFAPGESGYRPTFSAQMWEYLFGFGRRNLFLRDRDSPALCLDVSSTPPDVCMVDLGPYRILYSRIGVYGRVPASWDHGKDVGSADELEYATYEDCNRALLTAEAIHARGRSDLATDICGHVLERAERDVDISFLVTWGNELLGDIHMDLGNEDKAMTYYERAARGASPFRKHELVAQYYENRGLPEKAQLHRQKASEDLWRFFGRWKRIHRGILAGLLTLLGACGWLLWKWRLAFKARVVSAGLAAVLMIVYLHVLSPVHEASAVGNLYGAGVLILLIANVASILGALAAAVAKVARKEPLKLIPLELLILLPGVCVVADLVIVQFLAGGA